jgi:hypothetical protein
MTNNLVGLPHPIERRHDASAALVHLVEALTQQVHEMREELRTNLEGLEATRKEVIDQLLEEAFPGGDHKTHRKYHESLIQAAVEKAAFWKKMQEELTKWGLFGFLGWAFVALWSHFLQGPK